MARLPDPPATVIVNAMADVVGAQPCARATIHVLDRLHEAGWGFAPAWLLEASALLLDYATEELGIDPDTTRVTVTVEGRVTRTSLAEVCACLADRRGGTDPRLPERRA